MSELELKLNTIYQGHILDVLKTFPDNHFSLIVTSSPYWGLRDYSSWKQFNTKEEADNWSIKIAKEWTELTNSPNVEFIENPSTYDEKKNMWTGSISPRCVWEGIEDCEHEWGNSQSSVGSRSNDSNKNKNKILRTDFPNSNFCINCNAWKGQLGLEPDFNMFIDHLIQIFDECKRILRKDGALWVNLGDTYYGGGNASGHTEDSKNFGLSTLKRGSVTNPVARGNQLKNKTLVGVPDRFKIAMIDNEWICRNEIIWHKPNCMPSSVKDRFTVDFEKFFFFTKNKRYYFEQQFEPIKEESLERLDRGVGDNVKWSDGSKFGQTTQTLAKPRLNKKYRNQEEETKHRQGMNKDRGNGMIRKRNLPDQKKFVDYMRSADWYPYPYNPILDHVKQPSELSNKTKIGWICYDLNLEESKVEHWFRYDDSGFAHPSTEDWLKFQDFYDIDKFSELVEYWEEPDTIKPSMKMNWSNQDGHSGYYNKDGSLRANILGRNKRAVWSINTKPFPGAHFAVFPEELILPIIKSCVPKEICTECDKPRINVIEKEVIHNRENTRADKKVNVEYSPKGQDRLERPPTDWEPRPILNEYLSDCGCNSKFEPGIVLDCFMGAGTTGVVAKKEKIKWVGIELNPEYIEMATERIRKTPVYHELNEWF